MKTNLRIKYILGILVLIYVPQAFSVSVLKASTDDSLVRFELVGRSPMITVSGEGKGATAVLNIIDNKLSGEVVFQLDSLASDLAERDQIMKDEYLETKAYSTAKLVFKNFQMPLGWSLKDPIVKGSSFRAKMYLHGIEKEITGNFSILDKQLATEAKFDIKLSEFKIKSPEYMGLKIGDIVKVIVKFKKMNY